MAADERSFPDYLGSSELLVQALAPRDLRASEYGPWPRLWARQGEIWVDVACTYRGRQLACALAFRPDGVSAEEVTRLITGDRQRRSNTASKESLRAALQSVGLEALFTAPTRGGHDASDWALLRTTTDIHVALAAAKDEQWTLAAEIMLGGSGVIVGFTSKKARTPAYKMPLRGRASSNARAASLVPDEMIDAAIKAAQRVRAHLPDDRAPVRPADNWIAPPVVELTDAALPTATEDLAPPDPEVVELPDSAVTDLTPHDPTPIVPREASAAPVLELEGPIRLTFPPEDEDDSEDPPSVVLIPLDRPGPWAPPRRRRAIALVTAGILALIAAAVVVLGSGGDGTPSSRSPLPALGRLSGGRYEQETFRHSLSSFRDPSGPFDSTTRGPDIEPGRTVIVSCRLYARSIPSAGPKYEWYRLASPPWSGRFYATANAFLNGDSALEFRPGQHPQDVHDVDLAVPTCGQPAGSRKTAVQTVRAFADLRTGKASGSSLERGTKVVVACKVATPTLESTSPANYAYRLASAPYDGHAYAAASALEPRVTGTATLAVVDNDIPDCTSTP